MRAKFSILLLLLLPGCFKHIPYTTSQAETFRQRPENIRLEFATGKGQQTAFYIPPLDSPEKPPTRLNILYPGIGSVALGWMRFINLNENPATGYLLIDYPGRGFSEGTMHPGTLYLNSEGALQKLAEHFGRKELDVEINLMGHSFGTGAALQFAARRPVKRIVLVAPFSTLKEGVAVRSWLLSLLTPVQIDNRELIKRLLAGISPPEITILHGTKDTSLPVTMGRELAAQNKKKIRFYEFPEDNHVNILSRRRQLIFNTLNGLNE